MQKPKHGKAFHRRHTYCMADLGEVLGWRTERVRRFLRRKRVSLESNGRWFFVTREVIRRVFGEQASHVLADLDDLS